MLPTQSEMQAAFMQRDANFDGVFFTGVRTTGIFCRPTCPARKPKSENIEFFATGEAALLAGYRPCKRCRPQRTDGDTPDDIAALMGLIELQPEVRLKDQDLRDQGLAPETVRRWFKKHYGVTFHAWQRSRRVGDALAQLAQGGRVLDSAMDAGFDSASGFAHAVRQLTGKSPRASSQADLVRVFRIETPLGPMLAGTADAGVCLLEFTDRRMLETQFKTLEKRMGATFVPGRDAAGKQLERELAGYFAGKRRRFSLPVTTPGTDFQRAAWQALREIPYGQTRSYADQARALEKPRAVRAVAQANGRNRVAIVVPCHRVIASDGSLSGYGGGVWRKRWLLEMERKVLLGNQGC